MKLGRWDGGEGTSVAPSHQGASQSSSFSPSLVFESSIEVQDATPAGRNQPLALRRGAAVGSKRQTATAAKYEISR